MARNAAAAAAAFSALTAAATGSQLMRIERHFK